MDEIFQCRVTPFGHAVLAACASRLGVFQPEVMEILESKFKNSLESGSA
jgi:hypothetical protein